ncbi:MAG: AMP-binding protein [Treponema sp.]|jgi:long-chain acyl-CoA synthetase|nr:AMP-binding protein [Treponema sp.]
MVYLEQLTLAELGQKAAHTFKERRAFEIYRDGITYNRISYREFGIRIRQIGSLFVRLGMKSGDRVMILAENRPEWAIAYFGAAFAGLVSVPTLTGFSSEQIKTIAAHAGAAGICVTEKTAAKIAASDIDKSIPCIYIDSFIQDVGVIESDIKVCLNGEEKRLLLKEWEGGFPEIQAEDLASIIYTSGTAGSSKGVMLSNRNLLFTALSSRTLMKIYPRDRLLSVIPLAHTYECTLGLLTAVMSGASTAYLDRPPSPAALLPALQTLRPTAMITVPLFIEKLYRGYIAPALIASPLYKFPLTQFLAIQLAGHKLTAALGASIRFFGIGGASLSEETEAFLRKIQFPYAPGYGLTEAAPLVAGAGPYRFPFGSAGSVLKGVEVRIASDPAETEGEIQVRGPNVMLGYYRDEALTKKAFTPDGWLKTGDLGRLDKKNNLYIRGRLKTMILGPAGENIYPEEIKELLGA